MDGTFLWCDRRKINYFPLSQSSVIWGADEFIAVGQRGLIISSPDGEKWTMLEESTTEYINEIIWDGKQYIAVGNNENLIYPNKK